MLIFYQNLKKKFPCHDDFEAEYLVCRAGTYVSVDYERIKAFEAVILVLFYFIFNTKCRKMTSGTSVLNRPCKFKMHSTAG